MRMTRPAAGRFNPFWFRPLKRFVVSCSVALLAAAGIRFPPASAGQSETLKVGLPGNSIEFARWFIANDAGFFQKNGLQVVFVHLAPNTVPAALVSHGIEATPLGTSVLSGNLAGFHVKLVGQLNTKLDFMILSDKSIRSVADLKHKTIVTGPPKGGLTGVLRFTLKKHGIDPAKDVKLVYIGSVAARRTLIEAHKADAIIIDVANGFELEERLPNLHTLVPTAEMPDLLGSSVGVSDDMIKNNPDEVHSMLLALAQTFAFIRTHPAEVVVLLKKELKLSPSVAKRSAEAVAASMAPSLLPPEEMYDGEAEIESMLSGKKVTAARIKAAWDIRIAAQVQKEMSTR